LLGLTDHQPLLVRTYEFSFSVKRYANVKR